MVEKTYTVIEKTGIHARPATVLVQTAEKFDADVNLEYKDKTINLKSIMGVMAAGITSNSEIKIKADGPDEEQALAALDDVMTKEGIAK
ncbi:phosphocarrier protein HPr [Caldibacillus thermoamylovorans]|uniref:phosphocarrier protein HPr n=1 Tax=Caldibacillus thermoamylovorans TaxID=35841 RepID=UPI001D063624|nr:phosphocarrier protein HPr [Caldibacillus thermoamylovorans]MCB5936914.1 phosphocarrier protein HPr [Bacillus sp. DFI.2.34]MCB7078724.1 phosphocarrier protein HPr [Caldibacillus thermoamylovorans]